MKFLSDAAEYGLRAVVWLAQRPGKFQKVREIAEGTHAAPGYLVKVLQSLTREDILAAQRGSQGGFKLLRDPRDLTVLEVIEAVDPIERIRTCPLGLESHGRELCPMHQGIDNAIAAVQQSFSEWTIADLLKQPAKSKPLCNHLTVGKTVTHK